MINKCLKENKVKLHKYHGAIKNEGKYPLWKMKTKILDNKWQSHSSQLKKK